MLPSENLPKNQPVSINCIGGLAAVIDSKAAYRSSRLPAFEGGGGKNGAGPKPSALGGLVFITATGFLGVLTGCGTVGGVEWLTRVEGWVAVNENGSMESVWKLIGGVGVILSICWIPALKKQNIKTFCNKNWKNTILRLSKEKSSQK